MVAYLSDTEPCHPYNLYIIHLFIPDYDSPDRTTMPSVTPKV